MRENEGRIYPRTITDVQNLMRDPSIVLDPCSDCPNRNPDRQLPCNLHTNGMSEIGVGVVCEPNKIQITGTRIESQSQSAEIALEQGEVYPLNIKLAAD